MALASRAVAAVDRYAVVGHPVAHSRSPQIHAAFARQLQQDIEYTRLLAPRDGFVATVDRFFASGGRGLNVTLPFKLEAFAYCEDRVTERARDAGAVNLLVSRDAGIEGDNTDGAGLVADLVRLHALVDRRVLLLGAGGAARGVVGPLLASGVGHVTIVNRSVDAARRLAASFEATRVTVATYDALPGECFDIVVNATSASLAHASLPVPRDVLAAAAVAYDMMYGPEPTPFMRDAVAAGTPRVCDGLGMLVEQAAESFAIWRGMRPATAPVLAALRVELQADRR